MKKSVNNETYDFIGSLSIALYSHEITITLTALKQILKDRGVNYSQSSNQGLGASVAAAYHAWEGVDSGIISHAIKHTFVGQDGKPAWEK